MKIYQSQSKRNQKLKHLLPLLTLVLVVGIAFWPTLHRWLSPPPPPKIVSTIKQESLENHKESTGNEARDLYFDGVDRNNQPYTLTAKQGVESAEGFVELTTPKLVLKLNSGKIVTLTADKAIFYKDQQKIELIDQVKLTHTTGYEFVTKKAWLDMKDSSAFGHDPITGTGPQGDIRAPGGFKLTDKGDKVLFIGRPELMIHKGNKGDHG
jgi:lipopolysaccharide export system protein LptC